MFFKAKAIAVNTEELILISARHKSDSRLSERAVNLIKAGVDWAYFSNFILENKIVGSAYNLLEFCGRSANIPPAVLSRLRSANLFLAYKITLHHQKLKEILKLFYGHDIAVVPLKGTILSRRLYGEVSARGLSVDFDFFIAAKDRGRVQALLEKEGFSLSSHPREELLGSAIFSRSNSEIIDLHWSMLTPFYCPSERLAGFLKSRRLVEEEGVKYYEFKEEELLLYLSAHLASSSCFGRLRDIGDIKAFLDKYRGRLNWPSLMVKAREWRLSSSLYAALKLSGKLFSSDLPSGVPGKLRPGSLKLILIRAVTAKKIILGRELKRQKVIVRLFRFVLFRLIESRSLRDYIKTLFPPKQLIKSRSYLSRIFKALTRFFRVLSA